MCSTSITAPSNGNSTRAAKGLKQALVVSPDPANDAAHLARMIDRDVRNEPDSAVAVPSGSDRADFVFLTKGQLGRRYPNASLAGLHERGGAGLVLTTGDLAAAETAVAARGPQRQ